MHQTPNNTDSIQEQQASTQKDSNCNTTNDFNPTQKANIISLDIISNINTNSTYDCEENVKSDKCKNKLNSTNDSPKSDTVLKYVYKKDDKSLVREKSKSHPLNSIQRKRRSISIGRNAENITADASVKAPLIVDYETSHPPGAETSLPLQRNTNTIQNSALADFNIVTSHDPQQPLHEHPQKENSSSQSEEDRLDSSEEKNYSKSNSDESSESDYLKKGGNPIKQKVKSSESDEAGERDNYKNKESGSSSVEDSKELDDDSSDAPQRIKQIPKDNDSFEIYKGKKSLRNTAAIHNQNRENRDSAETDSSKSNENSESIESSENTSRNSERDSSSNENNEDDNRDNKRKDNYRSNKNRPDDSRESTSKEKYRSDENRQDDSRESTSKDKYRSNKNRQDDSRENTSKDKYRSNENRQDDSRENTSKDNFRSNENRQDDSRENKSKDEFRSHESSNESDNNQNSDEKSSTNKAFKKQDVSNESVENSYENNNEEIRGLADKKLADNTDNVKDSDIRVSTPRTIQDIDLGDFSYERIKVDDKGHVVADRGHDKINSPIKPLITPDLDNHIAGKLSQQRDKDINLGPNLFDIRSPVQIDDDEVKPVIEIHSEQTNENESNDENSKEALKASPGKDESLETILGTKIHDTPESSEKFGKERELEEKADVKQQFERIPLDYKHRNKNEEEKNKDEEDKRNDGGESQNHTPKKDVTEVTENEGTLDTISPEDIKYDENLNYKFDDIKIKLPEIKLPDDILAYAYEGPQYEKTKDKKRKYKPTLNQYSEEDSGESKEDSGDSPRKLKKDKHNNDDSTESNERPNKHYKSHNDEEDGNDHEYYGYRPKFTSDKQKLQKKGEDHEDDEDEDLYEKFVRERFGKRGSFHKRSEKLQDGGLPYNPKLYETVQKILKNTAQIDEQAKKSGDPNAGYAWTLEYGENLK